MWAEKFIPGSRFFSLSRAYTGAWAEKLPADSRFLSPSRAYTVARAEKLPADSRFLSPSLAYTVMWAEKIQNIRHIIDNISVQAGRYAVARAESSAHMRSKICKKAYLFDKEKHLW